MVLVHCMLPAWLCCLRMAAILLQYHQRCSAPMSKLQAGARAALSMIMYNNVVAMHQTAIIACTISAARGLRVSNSLPAQVSASTLDRPVLHWVPVVLALCMCGQKFASK